MTALFSNALAWVDWKNKSINKKLLSWNLESLNELVLCMPIKIRAYVHLVLFMCIYLNVPAEHGVRSHISMEKWTHIYANIPMNTFISKITYTHMRTRTFSAFVFSFLFCYLWPLDLYITCSLSLYQMENNRWSPPYLSHCAGPLLRLLVPGIAALANYISKPSDS